MPVVRSPALSVVAFASTVAMTGSCVPGAACLLLGEFAGGFGHLPRFAPSENHPGDGGGNDAGIARPGVTRIGSKIVYHQGLTGPTHPGLHVCHGCVSSLGCNHEELYVSGVQRGRSFLLPSLPERGLQGRNDVVRVFGHHRLDNQEWRTRMRDFVYLRLFKSMVWH